MGLLGKPTILGNPRLNTPPQKTNMEPKNSWLGLMFILDSFRGVFPGSMIAFRVCICRYIHVVFFNILLDYICLYMHIIYYHHVL